MTVGPPRDPTPYPFARLDDAKARTRERGIELIDFGLGDPREPTPEFIRQAMLANVPEVSSYPRSAGLPELHSAISGWIHRRYDADVATTDIVPTLGSKEMIHSLVAYVLTDERDTVIVPTPAYPVYAQGARFHGARVCEVPLDVDRGFLPDIDAIPASTLDRTALLWLNYPNNPTGAVAPLEYYEHVAALARRHGFVVASDEAYSDIYFDEPPASVLQLRDLTNFLMLNTLSKRSCMTGYRSGFLTGDPALVRRVASYRRSVGTAPQDFVQRASIAAWNDDAHAAELREVWRAKRDTIEPVLRAKGLHIESAATFFLWARVPEDQSSESFAERLLDTGIVVSPGEIFGPRATGFVRIALVPTLDQCRRAAELLKDVL